MWLITLLLACGGDDSCLEDGITTRGEFDGEEVENGTCAPEGEAYDSVHSCDAVFGPCPASNAAGAIAQVTEDPSRLDDPDLVWSTEQLRSCSCSCCHYADGGGAARYYAWDFAPVWTDSVPTETLELLLDGLDDEVRLEGEGNHGFVRHGFSVPTTDAARMRAYLERELDRR